MVMATIAKNIPQLKIAAESGAIFDVQMRSN